MRNRKKGTVHRITQHIHFRLTPLSFGTAPYGRNVIYTEPLYEIAVDSGLERKKLMRSLKFDRF